MSRHYRRRIRQDWSFLHRQSKWFRWKTIELPARRLDRQGCKEELYPSRYLQSDRVNLDWQDHSHRFDLQKWWAWSDGLRTRLPLRWNSESTCEGTGRMESGSVCRIRRSHQLLLRRFSLHLQSYSKCQAFSKSMLVNRNRYVFSKKLQFEWY